MKKVKAKHGRIVRRPGGGIMNENSAISFLFSGYFPKSLFGLGNSKTEHFPHFFYFFSKKAFDNVADEHYIISYRHKKLGPPGSE
jgi:hypothetical protein